MDVAGTGTARVPSLQRTASRRRFTGIRLLVYTCSQTLFAFRDHKLTSLTLLFFVLLLLAALLYLINAVAPVAPFVYSLI